MSTLSQSILESHKGEGMNPSGDGVSNTPSAPPMGTTPSFKDSIGKVGLVYPNDPTYRLSVTGVYRPNAGEHLLIQTDFDTQAELLNEKNWLTSEDSVLDGLPYPMIFIDVMKVYPGGVLLLSRELVTQNKEE